ncbi:hypothetical protein QFC21_003135 [Naganishia friedmannii]|uniref:Uncharacterized protein n=1 Tax=Naganishia friedmannii TaxID=89922 RepID=A0ACC2VRP5_9TREE|nr:hypothetical protein QFC21_003135 [Naganishia friedmannii]
MPDQEEPLCRILGTDCSVRVSMVNGLSAPRDQGALPTGSTPPSSRSPFVTAYGYDNVDEDLDETGNEQKLGGGERGADDPVAWKERISSLEQRLRIVETRLEASASAAAIKTRRRSDQQVERLAPPHFRVARTSGTNERTRTHRDAQSLVDSCNQPQRSSTQTKRTSEPADQGYSNSIVILIKYPAPYAGAQEILQRAWDNGRDDRIVRDDRVTLCARGGWVDPVASGLVTDGQMQASWLCFSTAFINVLPLPSLVRTSKSNSPPAPRHPFLKLAILIHVSHTRTTNPLTPIQCRHIRELLYTSLQNLWTVAPSLPVIRALIILALVPTFTLIESPDEVQDGRGERNGNHEEEDMDESRDPDDMGRTNNLVSRPLPSPLHLLQMAKNMALALGLARANTETVGFEGDDQGMDSSAGAAGLEGYLLWHCILQQEYWAGIIMSPYIPCYSLTHSNLIGELEALLENDGMAASSSSLLPSGDHNSHSQRQNPRLHISQYVLHTAKLQQIIEPLLALIEGISQCPTNDDFAGACEAFTTFLAGMEAWYSQFPRDSFVGARYLYITAKQYDYTVHLRMATWVQLLPRPVICELLYTLLHQCGRSLIRCGMQLIVSLTSYRDLQPFMPGGNHVISICAWAGLLHIQAMFKGHADIEWTGRKHASHLVTFEETARKLHPGHAGTLLDVLKDFLKHVQSRQRPSSDINAAVHNDTIPPGPSVAAWTFPANTAGSNIASRGMNSSSFQLHNSVSNLRQQQYPPSLPTLPVYAGVGHQDGTGNFDGYEANHPAMSTSYAPPLSGLDSTDNAGFLDASASALHEVSGTQMMPFLGEFTPAEMQAFETWWFDMLNADGTPEGAGAMLG